MKVIATKIFQFYLCCFLVFSCNKANIKVQDEITSVYYNKALKPFYHGVASGDPTQNEVVLWTRITPEIVKEHQVKWIMSSDSLQEKVLQTGTIKTDSTKDYTVKVVASKLKPDTYYWYSFEYENSKSIVGRTKTLPDSENDTIRLIGVSCNAYEGGYFNAFKVIGLRKKKIDAVVHLGDYIYESFIPKYIKKEDRIPLPKKELITLEDYRTRYAQYHLDANLRLAHQMHPFINIWDDHEISNDSYTTGAEGHNPNKDGDYQKRKSNAKQAFYEWLPIREGEKHYRNFKFGNTAELFMLDGRLEGRTKQEAITNPDFLNPDRHLLGNSQLNWLVGGMSKTNATWKIIGNPVLFSKFNFSPVLPDIDKREIDSWVGYPFERNKLLSDINNNAINDVVFFSGDTHSSWAIEIQNNNNIGTNPIAVEFGVPSISSENWDTSNPADTVIKWEREILELQENKHLKYVNLRNHGYTLLTLSKDFAKCTWYFIDKDHKTQIEIKGPSYLLKKGDSKITVQY